MSTTLLLIVFGVIFYAVSSASAIAGVLRAGAGNRRRVLIGVVLGAGCLGGALIVHGVHEGRLPVFGGFETLACYCLALTGAYVYTAIRYDTAALAIVLVPHLTLLTIVAGLQATKGAHVDLSVHSTWLDLHILTAVAGYALFTLACVAAGAYLVLDRRLKRRQIQTFVDRLPSLEALDRIMRGQMGAGFVIFTISIVLGVFLAHVNQWGLAWVTDPKIVATGVTWCVYGVLFYLRTVGDYYGRKLATMTMVGFFCVLFAFAGVRMTGATIHDFTVPRVVGGGQ